MAKKPQADSVKPSAPKPGAQKPSAPKPAAAETPRKTDPRRAVVDALMRLAAEQPYSAISLADIAREAGVSLADMRDWFPSKGAMLGGLMRIVDRQVLEGTTGDMDAESAHDRVLDVLMRRFDALEPYRDAMRSIHRSVRSDPALALALNQAAVNSWRYMLEAAGIDTQGSLGALKTQGAVLVFSRVFPVWLDDDPDLSRTMAAADRELKRGEKIVGAADALHRLAAPFRGFARAVCQRRAERRDARRDEGAGGERGRDVEYV